MKIESILKRPGGTKVHLDGVEYHFKPDADGREVCDVNRKKHRDRLLSISEGYRVYDPEDDEPDEEEDEDIGPNGETGRTGPTGNDKTLNPSENGGDGETSGQTSGETSGQSQGDGEGNGESGETAPGNVEGKADDSPLDREELAVQYEQRFGQRPHGRWSAERIAEELQAEAPANAQ